MALQDVQLGNRPVSLPTETCGADGVTRALENTLIAIVWTAATAILATFVTFSWLLWSPLP